MADGGSWVVTAWGGIRSYYDAPTNSAGGPWGTSEGGDLMSNGGYGGDGMANGVALNTGNGSPGPWGGGTRTVNTMAGLNGGGPGAGGSGVYDTEHTGNFYPGGAGANGIISVSAMTTYAGIREGLVVEVVALPDGWPAIDKLFASSMIDEWVVIDGIDPQPAASNWTYDGATFHPPVEPPTTRRRG